LVVGDAGAETQLDYWLLVMQVLKHSYFMVGQNLLSSRQLSATAMRITASPQKVAPAQPPQQQQQQDVADDWQRTVPSQVPAGSKPLTKQLSKDLFPWLSETEHKHSTQAVLPQITHRTSPLNVRHFLVIIIIVCSTTRK